MFEPADLFDLNQTEHAAIFDGCKFAWDALKKIEGYLAANLKPELRNQCEGRALHRRKGFHRRRHGGRGRRDDQRPGHHRQKLPDPP